MSKELKKYVESALLKGETKEQITDNLINAGWAKSLVNKMLSDYSGLDAAGIIIPAPKQQFNQIIKDIFVYLVTFVTLSMTSFAVGGILFKYIDFLFKDSLTRTSHSSYDVSWAISQLIVAFPIFAYLAWHVSSDLLTHPEKRESLIRKMMIYFILLITSVTGIVDLTCVLTTFFKGELSLHSFSQGAVVFAIVSLIFSYYFNEIKQDELYIKGKKNNG